MRNIFKCFIFLNLALLMGCAEEDESVTFANPVPEARSCPSTNSLVGQTRALRVSGLYGIRGNVTIVSDCEIEISNFFYNGLGPNVSFYGGVDGDFEAGVNMSEVLNGRAWQNETLNLFLPEGRSFDEINSFSVWCFEFDVDFSSASF